MDFIVDFLVEFFLEIFCEGFLSAGIEVMPYEKIPQNKRAKIKYIAIIVSALLLFSLVIGGVMLLETKGKSDLGKVLIGFPVVYFITGIMLKIIKFVRKWKEGK